MFTNVVGSSREAEWVAYGDDSEYSGTLVYAFLMFKRTKIKAIVREFYELKSRFKFSVDTKLHCRTLLNGRHRVKAGLEHLSRDDIDSIFNTVVTIINRHGGLVRFAYAFRDKVEATFSGPLVFESVVDGEPSIELGAVYNNKGVLGFLAQACFANRPDGRDGPSPGACEIFISPDKTMVGFIGSGERQAHYLASGFVDNSPAGGGVSQVVPVIGGDYFPELYEVADVVAYICVHAIHGVNGRSDESRFIKFYDRMKWRVGSEFGPPPAPAK